MDQGGPHPMNESIAFDRAAEYYDRSRSISDEAMAATVELLSAELGGRGRVLEVGVGTGLLALPLCRAGLDWGAYGELDRAMGELGATARALPPIEETWTSSIEEFLEAIEENRHSWTWRASEEARRLAIAELRPWAERRFGDLAEPRTVRFELVWRAYDLA